MTKATNKRQDSNRNYHKHAHTVTGVCGARMQGQGCCGRPDGAYWSCGLKLGPGVDFWEGRPIVIVIELSLNELSNVLGLGVNGSNACKCGVRVTRG